MLRGGCTSRFRNQIIENMSIVERKVFDHELEFHLSKISFKKLSMALKIYGYDQNLTVDHMVAISDIINLLSEDLTHDSESQADVIYKDQNFCFNEG